MDAAPPQGMHELQIAYEMVTRCAGSCQGCILTADERATLPSWTPAYLENAAALTRRFVAEHVAERPDLVVALAFGQGDFMSLPPRQLAEFNGWMRGLATSLGVPVQPIVSSSVVAPFERMAAAAAAFDPSGEGLMKPPIIDLVFDAKKLHLDKFRATYLRNIEHLRGRYDFIRLVINVGPDTVTHVKPDSLRRFCDANRFSYVVINVQPTQASAPAMAADWPAVMGWCEGLMSAWGDYGVRKNSLGNSLSFRMQPIERPEVPAALRRDLRKEIYVDGEGLVYLKQVGFAEMPLLGRFGFAPIGRMQDLAQAPVLPAVDRAAAPMISAIMRSFLLAEPCASCRHATVCAQSGIILLKRVMAPLLAPRADGGCPVWVSGVLDAVGPGGDIRARFDRSRPSSDQGYERPTVAAVSPAALEGGHG